MKDRRIVFDTNVIISSFLKSTSVARTIIDYAIVNNTILASIETIDELGQSFLRPKFQRYLSLAARESLIENYVEIIELVHVTTTKNFCRDTKDDKFIWLALDGDADYIVTGDDDLLSLSCVNGISILKPRDFYESIR